MMARGDDPPDGYALVPSPVLSAWTGLMGSIAEKLGTVAAGAMTLDGIVRRVEAALKEIGPLLRELRDRRENEHEAAVHKARAEGDAAGYARAMAEVAVARQMSGDSLPEQLADGIGKGLVGGVRGKGGQAMLGALAVGILTAIVAVLAWLTGMPLGVLLGGK
jgi:hypothetical protein